MSKTLSLVVAAAALVGSFVVTTDTADAATRVSNGHLRNYCNVEKHRRGASRANIVNIVNRFNHWGQPELKCLLSFRNRQAWLIAGAPAVCRYITGNSNWYRQGSATVCRGSGNANRRSQPLTFNSQRYRPFNRARQPRCFRVGWRYICR